ncbi:MAG: hypothetical protein A2X67_14545 [Ignavibacteria bacterium GWA2_55_11]|nr:MAG: hypothetical protein A2X67_14545 [Ignavibacteria bacterium GWA2_55_11]
MSFLRGSMGIISSAFRSLVDFVYPPLCLSCNRLLEDGSDLCCAECLSEIPRLSSEHPLFIASRDRMRSSGVVDDLVSAFVFEKTGGLQKIIHALKYQNIEAAGTMLGHFIEKEIAARCIVPSLLVPVPLHAAKQRDRGYNQAEAVARGIAEKAGWQVDAELLKRVKNTRTQTKLSFEQRQKNVSSAFVFRDRNVPDLHDATVMVVDDVITTGATIVECARVLKEAGATRVVAASVALAAKDSDL